MPVDPITTSEPVGTAAPEAAPSRRPKVDAIAFIAGILVFAAGAPVYRSLTSGKSVNPSGSPVPVSASPANSQPAAAARWQKQTSEQNEVTVEVTPLDLSPGAAEWRFNIALDTHSVELGQDVVQIAVLLDGSGKEYRPLGWSGSPVGGHHRSGLLSFAPIKPVLPFIQLELRDPALGTRQFKWNVSGDR